MNGKDVTLALFIAIALGLCLMPLAMASTEEQQANQTKDAAQLKMEALEAELGEEGMKKVADYLALQASLPDVVKASPYSSIAFAATDNESRVAYLTAIDESDLEKEDKEKLKVNLQDIWERYPEKFVAADNLVLCDVAEIMDKHLIASADLNEPGIDNPDNFEASGPGVTYGTRWAASSHKNFTFYIFDGFSYRIYARNSTDYPDNTGFDSSAHSKNSDSEPERGSHLCGNESSKNNSAPFFGLLGSLACLFGGWKLRKK